MYSIDNVLLIFVSRCQEYNLHTLKDNDGNTYVVKLWIYLFVLMVSAWRFDVLLTQNGILLCTAGGWGRCRWWQGSYYRCQARTGDANSENSKAALGELPKDSKDPTEETCAFTFIYTLTSLSLYFRSCFSCLLGQDEWALKSADEEHKMQNQATNPYTTKLTAEKVTMINAVSAIIVTCTSIYLVWSIRKLLILLSISDFLLFCIRKWLVCTLKDWDIDTAVEDRNECLVSV